LHQKTVCELKNNPDHSYEEVRRINARLVMEEVFNLQSANHVVLFSDSSPTVHWVQKIAAKGSLIAGRGAYAAESTQSTKDSSNSTGEISSDSKHTTTSWTFVDVLATSTHSIVSGPNYLGRHKVTEANTSTNSIPKIICL
jgi:hypothetical protein